MNKSSGDPKKAREWDDLKTGPKLSKALRKFIADTLNAELAAEGKAHLVRVENLSFEERGSSQKPQQRHQGPGKTHALRKKQGQLRWDWEQAQRREHRQRHGKERAALKLRQDFGLQTKLAELQQREKQGREAIDRDIDQQRRDSVLARIQSSCDEVAARRRVQVRTEIINADPPAQCDGSIIEALTAGAVRQGLDSERMVSRAYHDSLFMAGIAPVAMLFIPCRGGFSHRPDEYASPEAISNGVLVLAEALAELANS